MTEEYSSIYPEITIDTNSNSPNASMAFNLTLEQYYDIMHHTHDIRDIQGLSIGTGDSSIDQVAIDNINNNIAQINDQISNIDEKINRILDYIDQDIQASDV